MTLIRTIFIETMARGGGTCRACPEPVAKDQPHVVLYMPNGKYPDAKWRWHTACFLPQARREAQQLNQYLEAFELELLTDKARSKEFG